jgi:hypothetical protein
VYIYVKKRAVEPFLLMLTKDIVSVKII